MSTGADRALPRGAGPRRARGAGVATAIALALAGCAPLLPIEKVLTAPPPEERPQVVATPASDLEAPEGLRAEDGEYRVIPLQWDPLLRYDVGGYRIEYADAPDGPFRPLVDIWGRGVSAHADDGGLQPLGDGVARSYRIRAFTPEGLLSERASEAVTATTAPPPDPPEGLRAYSHQPRQVPLSWRAASGLRVVGYTVERSPAADGPFEEIAQLEGRHITAFVDQPLGDLQVFFYRVASRNAGGARGPTTPAVRAVTKPEPLPPLGLHLVEQRLGVNVLAWEPNVEPDIAEYRLMRVAEGGVEVVARAAGDQTRVIHQDVGTGVEVRYQLVAVDRDQLVSRPSEPVQVQSLDYELVADAQPDAVHLHWDPRASEGFVRARIERLGWLGSRELGTADEGHFVDRDVRPGGVYRYVARLERADGSSAPASRTLVVKVPQGGDFN